MKVSDILNNAVSISEKYAVSAETEKLKRLAQAIADDRMKVVVLGDFKAGKSTLLNRIFIRKNLLPTNFAEATAVPTHLSNGEMRMSTWLRKPEGDVMVKETSIFSEDQLAAIVTAADEKERAQKALEYSRVCISMPGILPDKITLVDTPGLNTTNTAIYTGTLEEARSADAILYVVRAKQLSNREESLIVDIAGSQNLKVPVHIVLTHDNAANIEESQLNEICRTIKAQLKLRGVNCGVSVFNLSEAHSGSPVPAVVEKIDTSINDWGWGRVSDMEKKASAPKADTVWGWDSEPELTQVSPQAVDSAETSASAVSSTEEALLEFFNGEVRDGRLARTARELKPLLLTLQSAIEARLALADVKAEEIQKIEQVKNKILRDYLCVVDSLLQDVGSEQIKFVNIVEKDIDDMRRQNVKALEKLEKSGEILTCISDWQDDIPAELQKILMNRKRELLCSLNQVSIKHKQDISIDLTPVNVETEMPSDRVTNIITKTPNWLLQLSDVIIFDMISPLPIWLDVFVRMVAEKLPLIRNVMPANLAATAMRNMAVKKLDECVHEVKVQVRQQLNDKFESFNNRLRVQLTEADIFAEHEAAIEDARQGILTPDMRKSLEYDIHLIRSWRVEL